MNEQEVQLRIVCPSFGKDGEIPKKHTGFAEDISPEFQIENIRNEVKSLAIIMDDLDIPMVMAYNHWLIWNIPVSNEIPENIPYGSVCPNGAIQGIAYGKNRYRGPKQPPFILSAHRYRFTVYALECVLNLPPTSKKVDLIRAMSGHILQTGEMIGWYKR